MRLLTLGLVVALFSVSGLADELPPIKGIVNAEDMAVLTGSHWVLASSMAGGSHQQGAIVAVHTGNEEHYQLYPSEKTQTGHSTACQDEVPADQFSPHGMSLIADSSGALQLYVVNHGGRESIEWFNVFLRPKPQLQWRGCVVLPAGAMANAVAATESGQLYVTTTGRPLDGSKPLTLFGGEVLSWEVDTGWQAVANSKVAAANGIVVSADGNRLYVASWIEREVVLLDINNQRRQSIPLPFLADNLHWNSDGRILVTGQQTTAEVVMQCYTSTQDHCTIPSAIAVIDPVSLAVPCVVPVAQNMATVAVPVGNQLWLGTARGDTIYRLPAARVAMAQCH